MSQSHSAVTVSGTVWQLVFHWLLSETVVLVLVQFVLLFLPSPSMMCDHWLPDPQGIPLKGELGPVLHLMTLTWHTVGPYATLVGETHRLKPPTLARHHSNPFCVSYFTTRGPGKEHRINKPPPPRGVRERSKGEVTCPTISQNH